MIEITNLVKKYGNKTAVDNISFNINKGEIVGFLGPNGAGKTTTMNIITGYISSTNGKVLVDGLDILENPNEVKKRIGYLPENPPLYNDMTVIEYLNFVYELKKVKLSQKEHIDEILELVKISDVKHRKISNLSKGYKQRVGLAQALIGNPEVLILDEPTVGLDPKQIIDIRNVIKDLGNNRTIILSSHILPEVSAICERVLIINKGRIVASDTPHNLSSKLTAESRLQIRIEGDYELATTLLSGVDGVISVEPLGSKEENTMDLSVETEKGCDLRKDISLLLAQSNIPVLMIKTVDMSLEDIFLELTTTEVLEDETEDNAEPTVESVIDEEIAVEEEISDESDI